ncbi:MAG TPA: hypothetical protein VF234_00060 [Limnochordia bacterium]
MILTQEELLFVYRRLCDVAGQANGEGGGLLEALARTEATRAGIPLYPTFLNRVAVFLVHLASERPCGGLSEAVGAVAAYAALRRRGYRLRATADELGQILRAAGTGFVGWQQLTRWLKAHIERG